MTGSLVEGSIVQVAELRYVPEKGQVLGRASAACVDAIGEYKDYSKIEGLTWFPLLDLSADELKEDVPLPPIFLGGAGKPFPNPNPA